MKNMRRKNINKIFNLYSKREIVYETFSNVSPINTYCIHNKQLAVQYKIRSNNCNIFIWLCIYKSNQIAISYIFMGRKIWNEHE